MGYKWVGMKLIDGIYVYPWADPRFNNANSYLLADEVLVLVDPGHLSLCTVLLEQMRREGFSPKVIEVVLCTHLHPDHCEAVDLFEGALFGAHKKEVDALFEYYGPYLYQPSGARLPRKEVDFYLREGDLEFGKQKWKVFHIRGHSPGSICLYNLDKKALITGDVVFYRGVGRTDLMGDPVALKEGIKRLMELDVEYLLPGHGEILAGKEAVKRNFLWIEQMVFPLLL